MKALRDTNKMSIEHWRKPFGRRFSAVSDRLKKAPLMVGFGKVISHEVIMRTRRALMRDRPYPPIFCVPGDHIGDNIFLDGLHERDLLESTFDRLLAPFRETFARSTCLDVGANIGNHSVFFSQRFRQVYAFEPNPFFCHAFRATIGLNGIDNIELIEKGLGDEPGIVSYAMGASHSLGESHFLSQTAPSRLPGERVMKLAIDVGDDVLEGMGIDNVALMKLDVEGYERPALRGLARTIRRDQPIILFETHPEDDRAEADSLIDHLKSLGYAHFYTCERPRLGSSSLINKVLFRLRYGYDSRPTAVTHLEDREYLMLVASPKPLAI